VSNSPKNSLIIEDKYPGLKQIPRVELSKLPVPIQRLTGLEKELGFEGIYLKREEFSHAVYGGNKARKYDYQMADILKKKRTRIITFGGVGSNQVAANAVYCHQFGLQPVGFLNYQTLTEYCRYNIKLDRYYGSELYYHKNQLVLALHLMWYYLTHKHSYLVWAGTSTPLATIGFVNAAFELKKDVEEGKLPEPDYLFVADGSTGTTAGLTLGLILAGMKTKVFGVLVTEALVANKKRVLSLAKKTYKLMRKYDNSIPDVTNQELNERLTVLLDFQGGEYGLPTKEGVEAIELVKKCDNVIMETTYTGKTCSAMIAFIRGKKEELKGKTIAMWNTLNIVDHSKEANSMDWTTFPKYLHKFFNGTVPLESRCVTARKNCEDIQ